MWRSRTDTLGSWTDGSPRRSPQNRFCRFQTRSSSIVSRSVCLSVRSTRLCPSLKIARWQKTTRRFRFLFFSTRLLPPDPSFVFGFRSLATSLVFLKIARWQATRRRLLMISSLDRFGYRLSILSSLDRFVSRFWILKIAHWQATKQRF